MLTAMETHERVLAGLSDLEYRGEAILLMRAAAVSAFGCASGQTAMCMIIPPEVQRAIRTVFSLNAALAHPREAFEMALRNSFSILQNFHPTSEPFDAQIIAALLDYVTQLSVFRSTWSLLFSATAAQHVPHHMFAVRWRDLRREDIVQSIRASQSSALRTLSSIEGGSMPFLGYFVYILQLTHSVRMALLECVGEIFLNSADHVDVMTMIRHMYTACALQRDLSAQQSLWRRFGVLTDVFFEQCERFEDARLFSIGALAADAPAAPRPHGHIAAQCPFFFILQRVLGGLHARLSLLLRDCLLPTPGAGPAPAPRTASAPGCAAVGGDYALRRAMGDAGRHERYRVTLMLVTDCTRRSGKCTWQRNRYTIANIMHSGNSDNEAGGEGDGDDERTRREKFAHWVLNFVFPRALPAEEVALLRALVFQAASATRRRMQFTLAGMVFYVLRSDSTMDGGRMHFALVLHVDETGAAGTQGEALAREEAIGRKEASWAFRALEELCAAWSLLDMCNLAVQTEVHGVVSVGGCA